MDAALLLDRVNAARPHLLAGAADAVVADTGGWGLCLFPFPGDDP
jgi:hypothetical protein